MSSWLKTICFLIGSALLTHLIPSSFFRNLDTMIHEFGHAVMTLALSGRVQYIELYADHSGVTLSTLTKSWAFLPVSLAGYTTASLFAWFLFWAYSRSKQKLGLQLMTLLAALCLILFVRNAYGIAWVAGFIALTVIVLALAPKWLRDFYYLLLAFLCLEESVFGPVSLVIYAATSPGSAGDASNLAGHTGIPALVWACGFAVFALWCAKQAVQSFLGKKKNASPTRSSTSLFSE